MNSSTPVMESERLTIEDETVSAIHVRELKLDWMRFEAARLFYRTARLYWPNHPDYPEAFEQAPVWVRDRMTRMAEASVRSVNEGYEREADRQAELAFMRTFDDAVQTAKDLDRDHSRFDLIEDAFDRLRGLLHAVKPARIVVAVYRTALLKGGR
jgi:hypothetical protein